MKFQFGLFSVVKILSKLQLSYWALLFSYLNCFNLWFLALFFTNNDFFTKTPIIISILLTFALSSTWFIVYTLSMIRLNLLVVDNELNSIDFMNSSIFYYILFAENMIILGGFIYLSFVCNWLFITLITVSFILLVAFYFYIDYALKKKHANDNQF